MTRSYLRALTPAQLAELDAVAARVDLRAIGYTLSPEDARNVASWEGRTPADFAQVVAAALREHWCECRRMGGPLFPYSVRVVARAIELSMREPPPHRLEERAG